jgi:RNA polymerase-associated protein RTF1
LSYFPQVARQFQSERVVDLAINSSDDDDATHLARNTLGKLRLPRSLLEKWVEEPFFEKAVVGCFVRLGVGKSPGSRGEAQYKVCEIISVDEYKHAYAFGEFETRKALMLRIGRNQRLWRMNVISNHRYHIYLCVE